MKAYDFYSRVALRLNANTDRAKAITLCTLDSLCHCLTQEMAEELAAQLPRDMEHRLNDPDYDALYDKEQFVSPFRDLKDTQAGQGQRLGAQDLASTPTNDEAARQIQGVFSVLKEYVHENTAYHLAASLPEEVDRWFQEAP